MSEWEIGFQCNNCKRISRSNYDEVCGKCGEIKNKANFGYHGWTKVAIKWVSDTKWWNPTAWSSGHWKIRKME